MTTAFVALLAAVGFGVAETAIRSAEVLLGESDVTVASMTTVWLLRAAIYGLVTVAAWRMLRGGRWARLALTGGIGVIGLVSLVIEPLSALAADGIDLSAVTWAAVLVAIIRIGHILAVLIAVPAMYTPAARAWFGSAA
ncbi:hypothetical protein [Nocardia sp. NPDC024068]|uniref:hypothetical protein n=1 Tax=Nocardia sp. NPDC024068 TaxID=3157197 RepID=UPI0033CA5887